jgi:hypothetical protein
MLLFASLSVLKLPVSQKAWLGSTYRGKMLLVEEEAELGQNVSSHFHPLKDSIYSPLCT